ncbi:MAG: imidazolonepropionase [Anaerolineales bacterium]|nr:imidazolonepropionase [Anaerolineales bacterium]MDW8226642.1 imidazolonepropionase [Anaerolineales bacterium]
MLIHSASQLLTLTPEPQRGAALGTLNMIEDGAVLIEGETIVAVGRTAELLDAAPPEERLDASGCVVMPGFVDPHTHLVWAGNRAAEFELKMAGAKYLDILAAGGGILSTVRKTRQASLEQLLAETRPRLRTMFAYGTTTVEVKTGYGLETETEIKLLQAILALDAEGPIDLVPTFLGAHAIAPEFSGRPQAYTDFLCQEMLPAVRAWWQESAPSRPLPFVDVFCENKAFDLEQSRQILSRAKELGFPLKIHADEFDNLGGVSLAVELGAVSADHLVKTSQADIAALGRSDTVAVSLPCTPFGLAENEYTPARSILEQGGILALATDCNPGTAWCESMQFVLALACRALKLTPAQAIAAATINAAHALRLADRIGSLHPGKQADLLILSVPDYRMLGYRFGVNLVRQVVKRGRVYPVP